MPFSPEYLGLKKVECSTMESWLKVSLDPLSSHQLALVDQQAESHTKKTTMEELVHQRTWVLHPLAWVDHIEPHFHRPRAWSLHTCRPSPPKPWSTIYSHLTSLTKEWESSLPLGVHPVSAGIWQGGYQWRCSVGRSILPTLSTALPRSSSRSWPLS